jgi:hypothetical protein
MGSDDASSADMPRPIIDPSADPLALDEETVERLLAGDLPPAEAPPGYAKVAAVLAAATAEPAPEELAGQSAALAELRAVTRPRRAATRARRAARPPRRRWAGLAAVALVGALVTGGAAAATGGLPEPVRDVARSVLGTAGGPAPASSAQPGQQPPPVAPTGDADDPATAPPGSQAEGSTRPAPGSTAAGPAAKPDRQELCRAYLVSLDKQQDKKMDASAFALLAKAAGGESRIPAYCEGVEPGTPKPKDEEQQGPPDDKGQGQNDSPPGDGGGQGQGAQGAPSSSR